MTPLAWVLVIGLAWAGLAIPLALVVGRRLAANGRER